MNARSRHPLRALPALLALALFALPSTGCNYFRPSQPEVPTGGADIVADYSSPDKTLETMQLSIQDKSGTNGQSAYTGAFASEVLDGEGFTATFDPITVARFPQGTSTTWDLSREEIFYSNLSRLLPTSTFVFSWGEFRGAPEDQPDATPAIFYRSYQIRATPDDGATYVPVARGNAELRMKRFGSSWKIVLWIDSEDPLANFDLGELSFGQLRLAGP